MASDVEKLVARIRQIDDQGCSDSAFRIRVRGAVEKAAAALTQPAASGEQPSEDTARDAARYRWLLANGKPAAEGLLMRDPSKWSAAIDAAITGEKP